MNDQPRYNTVFLHSRNLRFLSFVFAFSFAHKVLLARLAGSGPPTPGPTPIAMPSDFPNAAGFVDAPVMLAAVDELEVPKGRELEICEGISLNSGCDTRFPGRRAFRRSG